MNEVQVYKEYLSWSCVKSCFQKACLLCTLHILLHFTYICVM